MFPYFIILQHVDIILTEDFKSGLVSTAVEFLSSLSPDCRWLRTYSYTLVYQDSRVYSHRGTFFRFFKVDG